MSDAIEYVRFDCIRGYELRNKPRGISKKEGDAGERKCAAAFKHFEELRGRVIGKGIRLEWAIATVIQHYFCPTITRCDQEVSHELFGPRVRVHDEFIKFVLFDRACGFNTKTEILKRIVKQSGMAVSMGPLKKVKNSRNLAAHRWVGIDFKTQAVSLLDTDKRAWEPLEQDFESSFEADFAEALETVKSIATQVEQWQIHGNPNDEFPIGFG